MTKFGQIWGSALLISSGLVAGPYLPPVSESPADASSPTSEVAPVSREDAGAPNGEVKSGARRVVREYERTMFGYTKDQGDQPFFDFTASLMFPLPLSYYGDEIGEQPWWRPHGFAAATVRGGQYINGRKSSPVVGKRFNPLVSARWWLTADSASDRVKNDRFIELVLAHESNGQWIEDPVTFANAEAVRLENLRQGQFADGKTDAELRAIARTETRDDISRGWDYVGVNFRWAADLEAADLGWKNRLTFESKFQHYMVLLQDRLEEYDQWENVPGGKPRNRVDGLYFKVNYKREQQLENKSVFHWATEASVSWRTGIGAPLAYNTWEFELGGRVFTLPVLLWYRTGYNSDFIDYFIRDESMGLKVIVEGF